MRVKAVSTCPEISIWVLFELIFDEVLLLQALNADYMGRDIVICTFGAAASSSRIESAYVAIRVWWHVITGAIRAGDPIAMANIQLVIEFWFGLQLSLSLICG